MATLSQYTFVPRPINNSMVGASQVSPTGSDGYLYYEVMESCQQAPSPASVTNISANLNSYQSGGGAGKRIGIVAYDWANARWSFINLKAIVFVKNGWIDDQGAIKDFCTGLAIPQNLEEVSADVLSVPPAIASLTAG